MPTERMRLRVAGAYLASFSLFGSLVTLTHLSLAQDTPQNGSVEGRVTASGTGAPVAGLRISLIGADQPPQAVTDEKGVFRFGKVMPHSYRIDGFDSRMFIGPASVRVSPGENVTGIALTAFQFPVISGHVRDSNRRPIQGIKVTALTEGVPGSRFLPEKAGSAVTATDGGFRISGLGLRPGRYTLIAEARPPQFHAAEERKTRTGGGNDGDPEPVLEAVPTYYPLSSTPAGAAWFPVSAGQSADDMDITLAQERTVCVQGRLAKTPSSAGQQIGLWVDADWYFGGNTLAEGTTEAAAAFEVCGLGPGDYRLTAQTPAEDPVYASVPFSVGKRAVHLGNIVLSPLTSLSGRLSVAQQGFSDPPALKGVASVSLAPIGRPIHSRNQQIAKAAFVRQAGAFEITGVMTDAYWLNIRPPAGFYVASATAGGFDVLRRPVQGNGPTVDIVLAADGPTLNVQVAGADGQPVLGATVVAGLDEPPLDLVPGDLVSAVTDQNGLVRFIGLRPGVYRVMAFAELFGLGAVKPPLFLANRTRGDRAELKSLETASVNLKVLRLEN